MDLATAGPADFEVLVVDNNTRDEAVWRPVEARCAELGVRVGCFRPPSVPAGTSRLRLTARADLAPEKVWHAAELVASMVAGLEAGTLPKPVGGLDAAMYLGRAGAR